MKRTIVVLKDQVAKALEVILEWNKRFAVRTDLINPTQNLTAEQVYEQIKARVIAMGATVDESNDFCSVINYDTTEVGGIPQFINDIPAAIDSALDIAERFATGEKVDILNAMCFNGSVETACVDSSIVGKYLKIVAESVATEKRRFGAEDAITATIQQFARKSIKAVFIDGHLVTQCFGSDKTEFDGRPTDVKYVMENCINEIYRIVDRGTIDKVKVDKGAVAI